MEQIDSKLDLFQSLKDDESNDHEEASQKSISESEQVGSLKNEKYEQQSDDEATNDQDAGSSSPDKELKKKVEKQNRKEIEEEEREKML